MLDEDAGATAIHFLQEANRRSEWLWSILFKYVVVSFFSMASMSITSVFLCWLITTEFDVNHFYHPLKVAYVQILKISNAFLLSLKDHFSLPWNQTTYWGYAGEIGVDTMVTVGYIIANGTLLLFFISMCIYHGAFYRLFGHFVDKLDSNNGKIKEEKLCDLIRFHISTKE